MILSYFILAHLLGDFVFQPGSLVLWKAKSKKGVFAHSMIHFGINLLVLLPFLINGYLWLIPAAAIISFVHFCLDQLKINYNLTHDQKVLPFVVDQLLHLLTILLVYFFISEIPLTLPESTFYLVYSDIRIIIFLSFIIFVSSVIEIFHYEKQREKNKDAKLKINSRKMQTRIIVLTLIYALFMILSFYARGDHVL